MILQTQLSVDESKITMEAYYKNDMDLDSLDVVDLFMELQDAFDISVPDEELSELFTVQKTVDKIEQVLAAK